MTKLPLERQKAFRDLQKLPTVVCGALMELVRVLTASANGRFESQKRLKAWNLTRNELEDVGHSIARLSELSPDIPKATRSVVKGFGDNIASIAQELLQEPIEGPDLDKLLRAACGMMPTVFTEFGRVLDSWTVPKNAPEIYEFQFSSTATFAFSLSESDNIPPQIRLAATRFAEAMSQLHEAWSVLVEWFGEPGERSIDRAERSGSRRD